VLLEQATTGSAAREVERLKAKLAAARERVQLFAAREARVRDAFEKGNVPQAVLDEAVRELAHERENVRAAEAEIALAEETRKEKRQLAEARLVQARADLDEAEIRLRHCTIRAPADGTILTKNAELGAYLSPQAFRGAGYVCEMADLSDLEMEVHLP